MNDYIENGSWNDGQTQTPHPKAGLDSRDQRRDQQPGQTAGADVQSQPAGWPRFESPGPAVPWGLEEAPRNPAELNTTNTNTANSGGFDPFGSDDPHATIGSPTGSGNGSPHSPSSPPADHWNEDAAHDTRDSDREHNREHNHEHNRSGPTDQTRHADDNFQTANTGDGWEQDAIHAPMQFEEPSTYEHQFWPGPAVNQGGAGNSFDPQASSGTHDWEPHDDPLGPVDSNGFPIYGQAPDTRDSLDRSSPSDWTGSKNFDLHQEPGSASDLYADLNHQAPPDFDADQLDHQDLNGTEHPGFQADLREPLDPSAPVPQIFDPADPFAGPNGFSSNIDQHVSPQPEPPTESMDRTELSPGSPADQAEAGHLAAYSGTTAAGWTSASSEGGQFEVITMSTETGIASFDGRSVPDPLDAYHGDHLTSIGTPDANQISSEPQALDLREDTQNGFDHSHGGSTGYSDPRPDVNDFDEFRDPLQTVLARVAEAPADADTDPLHEDATAEADPLQPIASTDAPASVAVPESTQDHADQGDPAEYLEPHALVEPHLLGSLDQIPLEFFLQDDQVDAPKMGSYELVDPQLQPLDTETGTYAQHAHAHVDTQATDAFNQPHAKSDADLPVDLRQDHLEANHEVDVVQGGPVQDDHQVDVISNGTERGIGDSVFDPSDANEPGEEAGHGRQDAGQGIRVDLADGRSDYNLDLRLVTSNAQDEQGAEDNRFLTPAAPAGADHEQPHVLAHDVAHDVAHDRAADTAEAALPTNGTGLSITVGSRSRPGLEVLNRVNNGQRVNRGASLARSAGTEDAYAARVRQLYEHSLAKRIVDPQQPPVISPLDVVSDFVENASSRAVSSWKTYRAALLWHLAQNRNMAIAFEEGYQILKATCKASGVRKAVEAGQGWANEHDDGAGPGDEHDADGDEPDGKRTKTKKTISREDLSTLIRTLAGMDGRAHWGSKTSQWLLAGLASGARINEWEGACWQDAEKTVLSLPNSKRKKTQPVFRITAPGETIHDVEADHPERLTPGGIYDESTRFRQVPIDSSESLWVDLHLKSIAQYIASRPGDPSAFKFYYNYCRKIVHEASKRAFKGKKMFSLYVMRSQFSANKKAQLTLEEVADLMGHTETRTTMSSYGPMSAAHTKRVLTDAEVQVKADRQAQFRAPTQKPNPDQPA